MVNNNQVKSKSKKMHLNNNQLERKHLRSIEAIEQMNFKNLSRVLAGR